jgi:RND family efflux transporter MFP subunit
VANIVRNSLAGAAMMALGLTLAACGSGEGDSKDKAAAAARSASQTVTAATAVLINQPRSVTASGTVSAWEEVPVGAETGGLTAIGVYVEEGTYVRQGQLLVKLNDEVLQAQLRQQEAGVASAEANAAREDAALARAEELRGRGFLSQASLDSATANQRSARAQLSAAQAALSETRTRLNQTSIRAPVAGLISSRSVTRGQIVQPGTELFRMVRDGRLELDAEIPEAELRLVRSGMTATIASEQAAGATGRVRIVTPEVNAQTRLGIARIALSPGSGLRPGMFARAAIDVGAQPAVVVPADAVVFREGKAGVYTIGAGNAVRFNPVTTGARNGTQIQIVSGLDANQRVVVQGAGFHGEGDVVTVVQARAAPAAAPAGASSQ